MKPQINPVVVYLLIIFYLIVDVQYKEVKKKKISSPAVKDLFHKRALWPSHQFQVSPNSVSVAELAWVSRLLLASSNDDAFTFLLSPDKICGVL